MPSRIALWSCDVSSILVAVIQRRIDYLGPVGARRLWQRRYYDFNVYPRRKLREKLDYMHANPVTEKLVKHPKDWPWSSWSAYVGKPALLSIDFVS